MIMIIFVQGVTTQYIHYLFQNKILFFILYSISEKKIVLVTWRNIYKRQEHDDQPYCSSK